LACSPVSPGPGVNGSADLIKNAADPLHITNVSLNTLNHSSQYFGTSGGAASAAYNYSNKTNLGPTDLQAGNSYTISVDHTGYLSTVGVWIDYNQDGDFNDPNEAIGVSYNTGTNKTFNFTVPNSVTNNQQVVMRVRCVIDNVSGSMTPCNNFGNTLSGNNNEVEDYRIRLRNPTACQAPTLTAQGNGASGTAGVCSGNAVNLTANPSGGQNCGGNFEYAWTNGTDWWDGSGFNAATPQYNTGYQSISTTPSGNTSYEVRAQCSSDPSCNSQSTVIVNTLGAPANLSASIGSPATGADHHLDVTWDAASGASSYELEYSVNGSIWNALTTTSNTSYDHNTGDTPNEPYYYRVRAVSSAGNTCAWNEMSTPRYTAADVPETPNLSNVQPTQLDLDLQPETPTANPSYTDYSIYSPTTGQYLQANGTFGPTEVFQTMAQWNTTTVTGLTPGTEYCFLAKARNEDGDTRGGVGATLQSNETFDSDVIANGAADPNSWWSPSSCTSPEEWDYTGANGCPAGAAEFLGNFLNFNGCFLRSPELNANGMDQVVMQFDLTNTIYDNNDPTYGELRVYIWINGGYKDQSQVPVTINGASTRQIQFDSQARNCEDMRAIFDISGIAAGNRDDMLLYIESMPKDGSDVYTARVDNIQINEAAPRACATTPNCTVGSQPTATWTGTENRSWTNCNNWNIGNIPGPSTDVTIPGSVPNDPLLSSETAEVNDMRIENGGLLELESAATLTLNGNLSVSDASATGGTLRSAGYPDNEISVAGDLTLHDAGTIDMSDGSPTADGTLRLQGDWTHNSGGTWQWGQSRVVLNGSGAQALDAPAAESYHIFELNKTNGNALQLNQAIAIEQELMLSQGRIATGSSHEVHVQNGSPGAVTGYGSSSYVQGNLRRNLASDALYAFPVGDAPIASGGMGYQLAEVDFADRGGYTQLRASFQPSSPGSFSNATALNNTAECGNSGYTQWLFSGFWRLQSTGTQGGAEYDLQVHPQAASFTNPTGNYSASLAKRPTGGAASNFALDGSCAPSTTDLLASPPVVTRKAIGSGFSDFAIVLDNTTAFPVEGLRLEGHYLSGRTRLDWTTTRELNNKGFHVQRRGPGQQQFEQIGFVEGVGTSTETQRYFFKDPAVARGARYHYRLRQEDFDGASTYSNTVTVRVPTREARNVALYPNPVLQGEALRFAFDAASSNDVTAQVYDAKGQQLLERHYSIEPGRPALSLPTGKLAQGIYLLQVNVNGTQLQRKFQVVR
jgi:hypothetical protein